MKIVAAMLLGAAAAYAAIGVTEPTAEIASTSNSATYAFAAFTPTANAVLVVMVFASGTVAAAPTITGTGLTWNRLGSNQLYNATNTAYAFWAKTGAAPGSTTITFDCTGDNATGAVMGVFQFTDADVATAVSVKQFKFSATTAANPTITFDAAMGTLNGYAAAFGLPRNPPTSAAPASWTETFDTGYGTPTSGGSGAYRAGGETGSTVTFTSASAAYGMVAVEVYVTGAGPVAGGQGYIRGRIK